jgi:hypothetical protein
MLCKKTRYKCNYKKFYSKNRSRNFDYFNFKFLGWYYENRINEKTIKCFLFHLEYHAVKTVFKINKKNQFDILLI